MSERPFSVLLVDDDPYSAHLFHLVLEYHNWVVTTVENADQAIEHLQSNMPDVIVVDLFLPGKDGYQTLDAIRALPQSSRCKIIATTSYYTQGTHHEVLERGFEGYLPKPYEARNLASKLSGFGLSRNVE
jgi:two-component system, cell cycle response regulator DivK